VYAIIEVGSKQYKVQKDDIIDIDSQGKKEQQKFSINKILLIAGKDNISIGQPYVKGAKLTATVLKNLKARKVISYKYRRRKSSHWKKGHRQLLSRVRIEKIELG